ncbi:hypothetical protein ACRALDRAFT_1083301 [Sodiomyces alcalophilus JCM 7366]|uniref:uncharacterized protein n=1 Tax=Sodiomyces alcalophilus JCM 7366 TaxID=591952 RepID=UPI0039B50988
MPLIIFSGFPTSGKSTRAAQLHAYLTERIAAEAESAQKGSSDTDPHNSTKPKKPPYRLHLISDATLSIPRTVYDLSALPAHARSANAPEKDARASIYGAVKRVLSDRDIVILDGLNYIKGWRYQLHCEAKAASTPSVVVQIGCTTERAREVNEARLRRRDTKRRKGTTKTEEQDQGAGKVETPPAQSDTPQEQKEQENEGLEGDDEEPYEPENWDNLVFRYEEPNPMTRWDSPLFTLVWDDDAEQARRTFDGIWDAIAGQGRKTVKPNQATAQRNRETSSDYLYVLDRETQDVVRRILERQEEGGGEVGGSVKVSSGGDSEAELTVELPGKRVGLPQLQRLRRAFVGLNRGGIGLEGVGDFSVSRMREAFVGYLNDSFEKEE